MNESFRFLFDYEGNWYLVPIDKEQDFFNCLEENRLEEMEVYRTDKHPSEFVVKLA